MTCFGPDEALTGAGITTCRRGFAHRCFCALGFFGGILPIEAFPGEVPELIRSDLAVHCPEMRQMRIFSGLTFRKTDERTRCLRA